MEHHPKAQAAFLKAYDAYGDDIFRFCAVKVSNRDLAHDLTQEVFMRYWQALREGTQMRSERAFLYTLARNLIIDWYRRKKEASLDALASEGVEFGTDDHRQIRFNAEAQEVLTVINELDEPSRDVLLLRYVEGFTPKEIAAMTGDTPNAVSVRINRATKKVQERLHIHD